MKNDPKISLKKVSFSDVEFLWYLRNRSDVHKYFRESRTISWREHIDWITPIILGVAPKTVLIIKKNKLPIGQIRINYQTSDLSISILKEFRERGIAAYTLSLAIAKVRKQKKIKYLLAEINKDNLSSIKLFEKLSFKRKDKRGVWLKYILEL